jgi:hypothetical protein
VDLLLWLLSLLGRLLVRRGGKSSDGGGIMDRAPVGWFGGFSRVLGVQDERMRGWGVSY